MLRLVQRNTARPAREGQADGIGLADAALGPIADPAREYGRQPGPLCSGEHGLAVLAVEEGVAQGLQATLEDVLFERTTGHLARRQGRFQRAVRIVKLKLDRQICGSVAGACEASVFDVGGSVDHDLPGRGIGLLSVSTAVSQRSIIPNA